MHPLLEQYQHTLLGRLKAKLFLQIIGTTDRLPTDRELWRHQMSAWKQNTLAASFDFHLIHTPSTQLLTFPAQLTRQQVRASLRDIAKRPPIWSLFVESPSQDHTSEPNVGCLVIGQSSGADWSGYYAAIMSETEYPACGLVSIVASKSAGNSHIAQASFDGWETLTPTEAGSHFGPCMALTALSHHIPDSGVVTLPLDKVEMRPEDEPPFDPECQRRIELVLRGKMRLARASVSRASIRLFDVAFAQTLDPNRVERYLETVDRGLLVYWDGKAFVSSDDYYGYLVNEMLGKKEVNVVIMGEFPQGIAKVERRGNHQLMPPALVEQMAETPGVTKDFVEWKARERLRNYNRLPKPSDLMARWTALAEFLGGKNPAERPVHEFLTWSPILFGGQWDSLESEVRFGKYKADIVLRAHRALPAVRLIELERPSHRLFTKDLHETDEVTHAVQQVSDWVRYCRQNPNDPVIAANRGANPDGMVIIGRSRYLSEREREILAHNNQGRDVKVITYDELLDDFGSLILHRLDDGSE